MMLGSNSIYLFFVITILGQRGREKDVSFLFLNFSDKLLGDNTFL